MQKRPVFDVSPGLQLFISLATVVVSFLSFLIIGLVLALFIFNIDFSILGNSSALYTEANLPLLKYLQIVQSISLFILPPFIIAWLLSTSVFGYLNLKKKTNNQVIIITILLMFSIIPVINFFAEVNSWLTFPESLKGIENWMREKEDTAMEITKLFLQATTWQALLVNVIMIAVLPAVGEELLFRGILQKQLILWFNNKHAGIIVSAILFSALHLQFYGFLPRTLLGVLFGYMLVWSGSLWVPILGHFVNNATIVIVSYFSGADIVDNPADQVGTTETGIWYFFLGLVIFIPLLWLFYQKTRQQSHPKI